MPFRGELRGGHSLLLTSNESLESALEHNRKIEQDISLPKESAELVKHSID